MLVLSKLKWFHLVIIVLILFSSYQYYNNTLVIQENSDLKQDKKDDLRKVRDSAFAEINTLTITSKKEVDSLVKLSQEIRYIPYEKLIYDNRSLDDALDILNEYKYEK